MYSAHVAVLAMILLTALLPGTAPEAVAQSASSCINDRYGNPQCPPPGGRCLKDIHGEIRCSPPGGGIALDRYRTPVCGAGQCITNRSGDVQCSSVAKGSAAIDRGGDVVCTGGCTSASASACMVPVK